MFPTPNVGRSPVDRGYLLPDEPEGHALRCVSFLIPDTIEYRAALYRQVYDLGVTETWDREDPHKAMLAAEVWTGALQGSFTVFEDDCPVITQIRPDPSGCGNLEQSTDSGATWTDIPGTDFLPRNGLCEMTGGLEIFPTANQVLLTMKGAVNPYQAAKIMVVQDGAGVDVAWINPRGTMELSGNAFGRTLTLNGGYIGTNNNEGLYGKDNGGTYRQLVYISVNKSVFRAGGSGFAIRTLANDSVVDADENGNVGVYHNKPTTGQTMLYVRAGAGQAITPVFQIEQSVGVNVLRMFAEGNMIENYRDAGTNNIANNVLLSHSTTGTPAAGFGSSLILGAKSSTTAEQSLARLYAVWETPTHATRVAKVALSVFDYAGEYKVIEAGVTGAHTPKIGFLGATPQPALAITGDHHKNAITKQIVELLALFGLCIDGTTNTAVEVVVGETQGYAVMQDLLAHLETYTNGGIVDSTSEGECLLVCEVPPEEFYCKVYDFTDEDDRAPWVIERGQVGTGFESTMSDEMVFIHTAQFDVFRVIGVTIEYNQSGVADGTILFGAYDFAGYISTDFGTVAPGTGMQVLADYDPTYDAFTGFRIVATSTDPAQQIQITGLKVYGYDQGLYGIIEGGTDCP